MVCFAMLRKLIGKLIVLIYTFDLKLILIFLGVNRLNDLVVHDGGIAILEKGESFGGGMLQYYGINSNTSSSGFMKCTFKKKVSVYMIKDIYDI